MQIAKIFPKFKMGAVLESLNSVKEVVEDIDEASKESSEVIINVILKLGSFSLRIVSLTPQGPRFLPFHTSEILGSNVIE